MQELCRAYDRRLLTKRKEPRGWKAPTAEQIASWMPLAKANEIAMQLAKDDSSFVKGEVRAWAKKIGCSVGTAQKTDLWQEKMRQTGKGRIRGQKPKVVALTEKVLAITAAKGDAALRQLVNEQDADFEPSPLANDPPDCRRKRKTRP